MTTWKKYGGMNKFDSMNNINVNSIVADYFSLRKVYIGTFDISGILHVSGKITTETNLYSNNIYNKSDISSNTLHLNNDAYIKGNIILTNDQYIYSGNAYLYNNLDMSGNLSVKQSVFLGRAGAYINGEDMCGNIGFNTKTPIAAFDISTNQLQSINVKTSQLKNYSVVAQNRNHQGILLYTDVSSSNISFFNDKQIDKTGLYDARIQYVKGGTLNIDVSDNVNIYSKVIISKDNSLGHKLDEELAIYNLSDITHYLMPVYENGNQHTGNALTLVAGDNSSNSFINIVTPNTLGLSIGGGIYPNDQTRAMGTLGWTDPSHGYIPSINIVAGEKVYKQRSSIGINHHAPETEKYSLDINGPIRIRNGEISQLAETPFEIMTTSFLRTNSNNIFLAGSPYTLTTPTIQTRKYVLYYSNNGGETWNQSYDLSGTTIETNTLIPTTILRSSYFYDSSLIFLAGDNGYIVYSYNGGKNWAGITMPITPPDKYNGSNIQITNVFAHQNITYLSFHAILTNISYIYWFTIPANIYTDTNGFSTNSATPNGVFNSSINTINHVSGYGNMLYAVGNNYIEKYQIDNAYTLVYRYSGPNPYNHLHSQDGTYIVAVGNYIISHTNDGTIWTNISVPYLLNSVYVYSSLIAMAVGKDASNNGVIIYTEDGYQTWIKIADKTMNSSGNGNVLTKYNLKNIYMNNLNEFKVTKTTTPYVSGTTLGNSAVYACYMPILFNYTNNMVFDISGVATISGDMRINEGGRISTNNETFNLLNENVKYINFGRSTRSITAGNTLVPRLGIATANVNPNYEFELKGNMFHQQGYIWQF